MRFLAISCSCCVFLLLLSVTTSGTFAKTVHGCAPAIPPPVSGTLVLPAALHGLLFLNEVLLTPHSIWNCSDVGAYTRATDAWIELYNAQNQAFDLTAAHTGIDSGPNTNQHYLGLGYAIAPHSFLVIFRFTDPSFVQTETPTLRLLINNIPVDEVTVPTLAIDQSYARVPDGGPTWQITNTPTIDASNSPSTGVGGKGGGSGTTTTKGATPYSTAAVQNDGIQPTWTSLHLPVATTSTSLPAATSSSSSLSPPQQQGAQHMAMDVPHKIAFTLLAVAFALTLLWCWKLFTPS